VSDNEFVTNFLKDFDPKHIGFTKFCELVKNNGQLGGSEITEHHELLLSENNKLLSEIDELKKALENQPVKEVHQNLNEVFEFKDYCRFAKNTDTSIVESIKRGLQSANDSLKESGEQATTTTKTVADFVPKELVDKVNLLHRHLLIEKKIPESTQSEYLEQLLTYSLKYFLLNEYPNIYKR